MKKFLLFLFDVGLLYFSLFLTLLIRYGNQLSYHYHEHLVPFSILFILWLIIFYIANLYDDRYFRNNAHFFSSLFQAISIAVVISIAFFYLIPIFNITPKTNLLIFAIVFSLLSILERSVFNNTVETKFKKTTILVGLDDVSLELAKFIKENPQLGYDLRYVVDLSESNNFTDGGFEQYGIVQGTEKLKHILKSEKINTVIIGPAAYNNAEIIDIFYKTIENRVTFYDLAFFFEHLTGRVPLNAINQIWFLENLNEGTKTGYELIKRTADVIFGLMFGLVSLVLYPFIILVIKVSSSGPIFYKQKRVGQKGRSFEMIKFRTMVKNAEQGTGAVWASDNDDRITGVGKFLRKTRLDEIPQLWNIVRGDMSMVGPRAERPEFHDLLKKEVPFYEERYLIKPGLSGWAQINFHYGSSVKDAAEKLKYDLYYIKNRSLVLDLGIVLKTIRIALQQAGK